MRTNRFEQQLKLPEFGLEGQQRLQEAKVLVVGVGGLGCPASLYLAAAGVGTIAFADGDKVAPSNLNRQILFGVQDIGSNKAIVAANFIMQRYPDINVKWYDEFLTTSNAMDIMEEYDIILDGSDNYSTRYMINDAAMLLGKPLVFGAIYRYEGQVAIFEGKKGSVCYRDLFPKQPRRGEIPNCAEAGVLGVLPGIIGILQAAEAIKWIANIGETLSSKIVYYNFLDGSFYDVEVDHCSGNLSDMPQSIDAWKRYDYELSCCSSMEVTWAEALEKIGKPGCILVDIRQPEEQPRWGANGCIEVPMSEVLQDEKPEGATSIYLFCQHGIRSLYVANLLQNRWPGIAIFSIKGGIAADDSPVRLVV